MSADLHQGAKNFYIVWIALNLIAATAWTLAAVNVWSNAPRAALLAVSPIVLAAVLKRAGYWSDFDLNRDL